MPVTGVPLEIALGWQKFYFLAFQKNNHASACQVPVHDYFFEMPKNQICPILMQLLMVPLSQAYQKLPKTIEPPPSKVNIEQATAICLKNSQNM